MHVATQPAAPPATAALRYLVGGLLMGAANLVPGVSGGTMLLAAGVYPAFIEAVASATRFKFGGRTLLILGCIGGAAGLSIVALAGLVRTAVVDHRWAMYSLFIGLTLGGVPLVWRLLRPATASAFAACGAGVAVMALMALLQPGAADPSEGPRYFLLFLGGAAGAAAMILPGVSGGYLLLILGQYVPILDAIDAAKQAALAAGGPDIGALTAAMAVLVPVGLGVLLGVVGVSNLVRAALRKYEKATLGLLLGLLLGAVLGLWPFQQGVAPRAGDVVKGRVLTAEAAAAVKPKDYPVEFFQPSAAQIAGALALIAAGMAVSHGVSQLGRNRG